MIEFINHKIIYFRLLFLLHQIKIVNKDVFLFPHHAIQRFRIFFSLNSYLISQHEYKNGLMSKNTK